MNPCKAKAKHLLCVDTLLLGFLLYLFSEEGFLFLLKKSHEELEVQISTSCTPYLMSFHGAAVPLSEMYDHTLGIKTYCQALLILWNYIKILEITLALMTGLFVCLFSF